MALFGVFAASSTMARRSACDLSTSMSNEPYDDLSAGISCFLSHAPVTDRNRSSCARTDSSNAARSIPELIGAAVGEAAVAVSAGSREHPLTHATQPRTVKNRRI